MKIPARAVGHLLSLIPFLAGGCKPRDLVCEKASYFQILQPEAGAGEAPFSIERLGPEVRGTDILRVPGYIILKSNNRGFVTWESSDFATGTELAFSPSEGVARNASNPGDAYPMMRYSDGASERVRFGFRSPSCRVPRKHGYCPTNDDNLFLAAELTCHPEQESRFSR